MASDTRAPVLAALLDGLRGHADLIGVQVEPGDPGDTQKSESVWIGDVFNDAELDVPVYGTLPLILNDTFRIPVHIVVKTGRTLDAVGERVGELAAAVLDFVLNDPKLAAAERPGLQVQWLVPKDRVDSRGRTPQGPAGYVLLDLEARTRLTGSS